jgi:hypothetical protein
MELCEMADDNIPRPPDVTDAEIKSVVGEAVGHLRIVSESQHSLSRSAIRGLLDQATRAIEAARKLLDRPTP